MGLEKGRVLNFLGLVRLSRLETIKLEIQNDVQDQAFFVCKQCGNPSEWMTTKARENSQQLRVSNLGSPFFTAMGTRKWANQLLFSSHFGSHQDNHKISLSPTFCFFNQKQKDVEDWSQREPNQTEQNFEF